MNDISKLAQNFQNEVQPIYPLIHCLLPTLFICKLSTKFTLSTITNHEVTKNIQELCMKVKFILPTK